MRARSLACSLTWPLLLLVACGDDGGGDGTTSTSGQDSTTSTSNVTIPVTSATLDTSITASDGTADTSGATADTAATDTDSTTTGSTSSDDTTAGARCGDGAIEGDEDCEEDDLGGNDCTSIVGGFLAGELSCSASCTFDTAACIPGPALDVEFCRLQFPLTIDDTTGAMVTVYGRVYVAGLTDQSAMNDPAPALMGWLGYGDDGSDPSVDDSSWTWLPAVPNPGYDGNAGPAPEPNNDEYQVELTLPAAGTYDYAYRFSGDAGQTFVHCDGGDPGNTDGYDPAQAGQMTSNP